MCVGREEGGGRGGWVRGKREEGRGGWVGERGRGRKVGSEGG